MYCSHNQLKNATHQCSVSHFVEAVKMSNVLTYAAALRLQGATLLIEPLDYKQSLLICLVVFNFFR